MELAFSVNNVMTVLKETEKRKKNAHRELEPLPASPRPSPSSRFELIFSDSFAPCLCEEARAGLFAGKTEDYF